MLSGKFTARRLRHKDSLNAPRDVWAHHKSDALDPLYARLPPPKQGSSSWMPANCRP
ncbi:hypothetical protein MPL3356_390212 [Mesorhizobium plurifarium]|uniref:Uncharacterized protein n=1 Tax=Mesorhizobium plurifarium TaxID=69974 RepID=A0A090DYS8_MESPL|nr:hypothetical protein MPL3356_390212 [Mesorhizobium plurifarium]